MAYKWREGYPARADANVAGEICAALEAEGRLTARDLVEEAKSESHPLHRIFEWDNDKAAESFRLIQAQQMIGALKIEVEDRPPIKKYYNIVRAEGQYHSIEMLMSSDATSNLLLEAAKREFRSYKEKYETLTELKELFEAGDIVFKQKEMPTE